jgi:hypothetical protein
MQSEKQKAAPRCAHCDMELGDMFHTEHLQGKPYHLRCAILVLADRCESLQAQLEDAQNAK